MADADTKQLIERRLRTASWTDAGQGRSGVESSPRPLGWRCRRRLTILRRRLAKDLAIADRSDPNQLRPGFAAVEDAAPIYEYALRVTSLDAEVLAVAAL